MSASFCGTEVFDAFAGAAAAGADASGDAAGLGFEVEGGVVPLLHATSAAQARKIAHGFSMAAL